MAIAALASVRHFVMLIGALSIILTVFLVYQWHDVSTVLTLVKDTKLKWNTKWDTKWGSLKQDPLLSPIGEPSEPLHRADEYGSDISNAPRINASLIALVRNRELSGILSSMRQLEAKWNNKFNYPWIFFNDEPFTESFKKQTSAATNAATYYEQIPKEHWDVPGWFNQSEFSRNAKIMDSEGVRYAEMKSYHQMCRWNSGFFYKHPALDNYQYYWRVEPNVRFFCDIDYDVFRYMQDHDKTYGFTINIYETPGSIKRLWPETMAFLRMYPEHVNKNNAIKWLTDTSKPENNEILGGYSGCHFWSNFEVGKLDFFRSQAYNDYFDHLDSTDGFFYERWGDAPVHSIALGLFEDKDKIHWFSDIGYTHDPYWSCPNSTKCNGCKAGDFPKNMEDADCRPVWFRHVGTG